jgi:hypothetical protein
VVRDGVRASSAFTRRRGPYYPSLEGERDAHTAIFTQFTEYSVLCMNSIGGQPWRSFLFHVCFSLCLVCQVQNSFRRSPSSAHRSPPNFQQNPKLRNFSASPSLKIAMNGPIVGGGPKGGKLDLRKPAGLANPALLHSLSDSADRLGNAMRAASPELIAILGRGRMGVM